MRGDFASLSATPLIALRIASNHLRLQSHSVCIVLVFTALTMVERTFFMWPQLPRDIGLTTSRIPPQLALRIPFHSESLQVALPKQWIRWEIHSVLDTRCRNNTYHQQRKQQGAQDKPAHS